MKPISLRYNQISKMSTVLSHDASSGLADFGDVRAEFHALLASCGVYDLSWRSKIALTGGDRVRWLNGMASNNVRDLAPGTACTTFC